MTTSKSHDHAYVMSSIADMMSGLMMVFLFIAVIFMLDQQKTVRVTQQERDQIANQKETIQQERDQIASQKQKMAAIAKMADQSRNKLNNALVVHFREDFQQWNVDLLPDNTVRFKSPEVLFQVGRAELTERYKNILENFFPRYVAILYENREDIEAVRIEGHTSSDWRGKNSFLENMKLSQQRAFNTLEYSYAHLAGLDQKIVDWLHHALGAQGFSFGRPILRKDQSEDMERSRRVDFRVVTKAEKRLYQILDQDKEYQERNTP